MSAPSPSLDKIKRKQIDHDDLDIDMEGVADGRPLRRRYEIESPSVQKKKHAQELAELRQQSEVLKQTGDIDHDEKQRQFGIIYSRRKRLREKQKVLELEEECDRIRASNQQLKVDNSRLEAILSVVSAQAAQMDQNQAQAPVAVYSAPPPSLVQAQPGQRFPNLPLPQVFPPFETTTGTALDNAFYPQPTSYLGSSSQFANLAGPNHYMAGNETAPSGSTSIPSLIAALTNQSQPDWPVDHQRMASQQLMNNSHSIQHFPVLSQQMALPQSRFPHEGNLIVPSGHQGYSDPQGLHSNMVAWNQGPSAALATMLTQNYPALGGMDGHHYSMPSALAPFTDSQTGEQFQDYQQEQASQNNDSSGMNKYGAFHPPPKQHDC